MGARQPTALGGARRVLAPWARALALAGYVLGRGWVRARWGGQCRLCRQGWG